MKYEHDDPASPYRRFERAIEWPMLTLSVLFIGLLLVPEMSDVEASTFELATAVIWAMFGLELVVLAALAPSKGRMLREHWLDVLIVAAPFLRPLRIGRLARVARSGGVLARAMTSISRVAQRKGLQIYGAFVVVVVVGAAALVYGLERNVEGSNIASFSDALWWAVVTTTTVGYGDHFPVSTDGRAVATVLMVVGIGLVGVVTANVAAYFVETEQADEIASLRSQLDRIEAMLMDRA